MNRGFVFRSTIVIMITMILFNAINYENINATNSISTTPGDKSLGSNLNNSTSVITPSTSSVNNNDDDRTKSSNNNNNNDNDNNNGNRNDDDRTKSSNNNNNNNNDNDNNNGNRNDDGNDDGNPSDDTPLSLPFNSNVADQIKEKEKSFDDVIPFP